MTTLLNLEQMRDDARITFEMYNEAAKRALQAKEDALDEWSKARIAYSSAKGHPLAGKTVQMVSDRIYRTGSWRNEKRTRKPITQTGVVTLCTDLRQAFHIRGHSPIPGEWYVASATGATGYRLEDVTGKILWTEVE